MMKIYICTGSINRASININVNKLLKKSWWSSEPRIIKEILSWPLQFTHKPIYIPKTRVYVTYQESAISVNLAIYMFARTLDKPRTNRRKVYNNIYIYIYACEITPSLKQSSSMWCASENDFIPTSLVSIYKHPWECLCDAVLYYTPQYLYG